MKRALLILCAALVFQLSATAPVFAANDDCPATTIQQPNKTTTKFEIGQCAYNYTGIRYQPYEFTTQLVACVEGTIHSAVIRMMSVISTEFGWVTAVLSTLAILFYGVRIALGEHELLKRTSTLFIKLAFIVVFMNMLPEIVGWVFAVFRQMLTMVVGGISPWQRIDAFLGNLVGFGPSIVLLNGLLGMVGAAIFSSKVGLVMFMAGIFAILNLLNFILSLIYSYLLAFLTIGFLLTLMPVMIPMALLFHSERYFKKWVDLIISAIVMPVLLFAFVWMFLGIFDILIQNIFDIMGGNDFRAYWRLNTSLCSWTMPSDPNTNAMMQHLSTANELPCVDRTIKPPTQLNINPMAKSQFDACPGRIATLNFGANDVNIVQRLSFAFTTLWIFSTLMKSMVQLIPQIAKSISAIVHTGTAIGGNSIIVSKIQGGLDSAKAKLESGAGADVQKTASNFAQQIANMIGKRD